MNQFVETKGPCKMCAGERTTAWGLPVVRQAVYDEKTHHNVHRIEHPEQPNRYVIFCANDARPLPKGRK